MTQRGNHPINKFNQVGAQALQVWSSLSRETRGSSPTGVFSALEGSGIGKV